MSLTICNVPTNENNNNDSVEAEKSALTLYRCPIASLDCMKEFSGRSRTDYGHTPSSNAIRLCVSPGLRYKNLGKSGLRVSNLGLGTWSIFSPTVSREQGESLIKLAFDSGINLFDLSEAHSGRRAEVELGKIIKKYAWKRASYVVVTKIYWTPKSEERGISRKKIIESIKSSLERLQIDYIDIVLFHKKDEMCPSEELIRAINYVINEGWCLYWGTAKWSHTEIMEAYSNCRQFNCVTPIVEQSEYHMFCRDKAELYLPELYKQIGVGLITWSPLSMMLSENSERLLFPTKDSLKTKSQSYSWTEDEINKEDRNEIERKNSEKVMELELLAEKLGCSMAQLSIAWSLKHETVQCILISACTNEQLRKSLQALQLIPRLSTSVMEVIESILDNRPSKPTPISTLALSRS